jgi:Flp pilus assembly protein TadG
MATRTLLRAGRERGQSTVELALIVPIILWIALGIVDLGRVFYTYTAATNAAREGARYYAMNPNVAPSAVIPRVQAEAAPQVILDSGQIRPTAPSFDVRRVEVDFTFTPIAPLISSLWGGGSRTVTTQALMPVMRN